MFIFLSIQCLRKQLERFAENTSFVVLSETNQISVFAKQRLYYRQIIASDSEITFYFRNNFEV